ncbi:MAG: hypothetical protein CL569_03395 [Alphaproteobacteria bacterium]|nr:hypothetical protein [Alphaproteobacteria bacterium]|tara:strand:+ start:8492 stop:8785 length:294 start_codon:yes stop_codon:yes gene_type:complete
MGPFSSPLYSAACNTGATVFFFCPLFGLLSLAAFLSPALRLFFQHSFYDLARLQQPLIEIDLHALIDALRRRTLGIAVKRALLRFVYDAISTGRSPR